MQSIDLIARQLTTVNTLTHDIITDLTDKEWLANAAPGISPIGFTLWHIVRTPDNMVQTMARGAPEVIAQQRWSGRGGLATPGIGAGFTFDEAAQIARTVNRADLLEYADAVRDEVIGWLRGLDASDLDVVPDVRGHLAPYPEYQRPEYVEEVEHLFDAPVWRLLVGPCVGHIRGHFGEIDILKFILQSSS